MTIKITKMGKWKKVRDDEYLEVWYRYYKIEGDKNIQVAIFTEYKEKPKFKKYWIGYYDSLGQQRGYGYSWKTFKEIKPEYKKLFIKFK